MSGVLSGRTLLVGVTGSIAAFRAADLVSRLTQEGACVVVLMTRAAAQFVGPLTFASLSHHPVVTDLFASAAANDPEHIALAQKAHGYIIAPATANVLAKLACGIADDAVTTTYLAASCPVIVAPAMNDKMWAHPTVRANVKTLEARGVRIIHPETGRLACGAFGQGRLASIDSLFDAIRRACAPQGKRKRLRRAR